MSGFIYEKIPRRVLYKTIYFESHESIDWSSAALGEMGVIACQTGG